MNQILSKFKGRIIEPVIDRKTGIEHRDVLGADVAIKPYYLKISMKTAIVKLLEKYKMTGCKPVDTPVVSPQPNDPNFEKPAGDFPVRECVGSLLHIANMARADISFAVGRCAREVSSPTLATCNALKRILKYLAGTPDLGIIYTPKIEKNFNDTYSHILKHAEVLKLGKRTDLPAFVSFCD
jgi:hypothetical protein